MESTTDTRKMRDIREIVRVFQFLLRLNPDFDQACD